MALDLRAVMCVVVGKGALKSKESPKHPEATTFKFPSVYTGFELHFHSVFFLLEL